MLCLCPKKSLSPLRLKLSSGHGAAYQWSKPSVIPLSYLGTTQLFSHNLAIQVPLNHRAKLNAKPSPKFKMLQIARHQNHPIIKKVSCSKFWSITNPIQKNPFIIFGDFENFKETILFEISRNFNFFEQQKIQIFCSKHFAQNRKFFSRKKFTVQL